MTHQQPLPCPDVLFRDGVDEYGYPAYGHAFSADQMHVHYLKGYTDGQAALSSQAPEDERAAFEFWLQSSAIRGDLGAWEAWQARAALQSRQPAATADHFPGAGEMVAAPVAPVAAVPEVLTEDQCKALWGNQYLRDFVITQLSRRSHADGIGLMGGESRASEFEDWFSQEYEDPNIGFVETTIQRRAAWAGWKAAMHSESTRVTPERQGRIADRLDELASIVMRGGRAPIDSHSALIDAVKLLRHAEQKSSETVAWVKDSGKGHNVVGYNSDLVNALPHGTVLQASPTPPVQPAEDVQRDADIFEWAEEHMIECTDTCEVDSPNRWRVAHSRGVSVGFTMEKAIRAAQAEGGGK